MFEKLVAIEPVSLTPSAVEKLHIYAKEVIMYDNMPENDIEVAKRIGNADAVLVSYTTQITKEALSKCQNVKYIGMCCSLYNPESANVDIRYANSRGIIVLGVRDYGDEGVVEYVISELVRLLHGFEQKPWSETPREITNIKAGIVGLGVSGGMIADALKYFGADISYFARSKKETANDKGYEFKELKELLSDSEVIFCCLNRNTILLYEEEFKALGDKKILFNTGLSPAWDEKALLSWLGGGDNILYCDTVGALGGEHMLNHPKIRCMQVSTGRTQQAFVRLSEKVIENILKYNSSNGII